MAITVKHPYTSTITEDSGSGVPGGFVGPNEWNALHTVVGSPDIISIVLVDKGAVGTGTVTFSVSASAKQKLTVAGAITIAFSGWPNSGTYGEVEIQLVNGGTNVTWPTVNWLVGDGTSSTTFSAMGVTLQASGTNWAIVWSTDGGTTLYGKAA